MLYLPIWLAASRYRVSAFRIRIAKISIENILLIVGIFAMIMTYSRVGLIGFLAVVAWLMVDIANVVSKRITNRQKRKIDIKRSRLQRIYITGSLFILLIIGFISLLYMLSFQDYRFKKIFTNATTYSNRYNQGSPALITLAKKINIGERVVYWEFGWEVFNKYPILGVGLGNVGRFSEELLSPEAWKMGEVRKILLYGTTLPNTKNLWVRILSETGIVGFSFYMTWLIILWLSARKLCQNQDATIRTIGLTGQFALIAQIFEGFSLDTFALPFLWVTLGILISTISISRQPIILHE
jgi:O-antigen ligase